MNISHVYKKLDKRESILTEFVEFNCDYCQQKISFPLNLIKYFKKVSCHFCYKKFNVDDILSKTNK